MHRHLPFGNPLRALTFLGLALCGLTVWARPNDTLSTILRGIPSRSFRDTVAAASRDSMPLGSRISAVSIVEYRVKKGTAARTRRIEDVFLDTLGRLKDRFEIEGLRGTSMENYTYYSDGSYTRALSIQRAQKYDFGVLYRCNGDSVQPIAVSDRQLNLHYDAGVYEDSTISVMLADSESGVIATVVYRGSPLWYRTYFFMRGVWRVTYLSDKMVDSTCYRGDSAVGYSLQRTYDTRGRLVLERAHWDSPRAGISPQWKILDYDSVGRLCRTRSGWGHDYFAYAESLYTYDTAGRLVEIVRPPRKQGLRFGPDNPSTLCCTTSVAYRYSSGGLVVEENTYRFVPEPKAGPTRQCIQTVTFGYDPSGCLTERCTKSGGASSVDFAQRICRTEAGAESDRFFQCGSPAKVVAYHLRHGVTAYNTTADGSTYWTICGRSGLVVADGVFHPDTSSGHRPTTVRLHRYTLKKQSP